MKDIDAEISLLLTDQFNHLQQHYKAYSGKELWETITKKWNELSKDEKERYPEEMQKWFKNESNKDRPSEQLQLVLSHAFNVNSVVNVIDFSGAIGFSLCNIFGLRDLYIVKSVTKSLNSRVKCIKL